MASQQMGQDLEVKQLKEFLGSYNRMTELCFTDCVDDFTTRKASEAELKCTHRCLEKFLKVSQRITTRFQEYQVQQNEGLMAAQAKQIPR
ncbi:Mitochondrial import inner membrane translocase subunit Tim9 [Holothuria leucospilota]|uniref:Mitochondrial import inner membrane translocase subunit n=1 Tax=Holothuria leucospilota TaxID=206669 RepID=A0A9Q1HGL3_HOLLE|nr:Mitochondrial import inner membrane translocase subunit Tim9 [Holothuria leucospilota]